MDDPVMVSMRSEAGSAVLDLTGDMNAAAEQALSTAMSDALAHEPTAVILNLSEVGFINSTGIALLVGLMSRAQAEDVGMRAYGLSEHYREIFDITRIADYIDIFSDESSALGEGGNE